MKLTLILLCGALASLMCCAWASAEVIDKPTPPPCCADGVCYPKRATWGFYQGRWRRWPEGISADEMLEPTAADRLGPDLLPFEAPVAEQEDLRVFLPKSAPSAAVESEEPPTDYGGDDAFQFDFDIDDDTNLFDTPTEPVPDSEPQSSNDIDPPPRPPVAVLQGASSPELNQAAGPVLPLMPPQQLAQDDDPPPPLPVAFGNSMAQER